MAAVAAAVADGADVIAVEALDHIGGNSVWSTGYLAFVGSAMQAECMKRRRTSLNYLRTPRPSPSRGWSGGWLRPLP